MDSSARDHKNEDNPGAMARILIIAYSNYVRDGRVKRHAEALAARGDEVDVICLGSPELRPSNKVYPIGIDIPRYRGTSRAAYIRSYVRFFLQARSIAIRRSIASRYDAAIVCSIPDAMVLSALPLRRRGARVILDIHDTMPELYREKFSGRKGRIGAGALLLEERASAFLADRVLAVHELHRERLALAGVPRDKIRVVLNSPDPRIFSPLARMPGGAPQQFTIVCHGTITKRLGLDIAMGAVELLRARIPDLQLIVIGPGEYLDEAKALVAAMNLQKNVSFRPAVLIEDLPVALAQADVGLIPNRASAATHLMLPVKLMEYAALGIPVIASNLRTIEHYFGNGAVRLFEAGNPHALADAIEELYRSPGKRLEFRLRALDVVASLSWERQRLQFFDAVDSVLGRPH